MIADISYALVLNLHQPPGCLEALLEQNDSEARDILRALDRLPGALAQGIGRTHLALSGVLLETLSDPDFQPRAADLLDGPAVLHSLQNAQHISILGTAYYHPLLPLAPPADWEAQLKRWQGLARHLFGSTRFPGFWPPEMGFCMELIPLLRRLGYRYVLVDSEHVEPVTPMRWEEVRYRPHAAGFGGEEIIVVVRDRELSQAQEAGMTTGGFIQEVAERIRWCDFPPLVTAGMNGPGGFPRPAPDGDFWTAFYQELAQRRDQRPVRPAFINEYLDRYGVYGKVNVGPGAWHTDWHHGKGFMAWPASAAQEEVLRRVAEVSQALHGARQNASRLRGYSPELFHQLEEVYWRILRAETSGNFLGDEVRIADCHRDLDEACAQLDRVNALFKAGQ